ncbi:MAG: hypothetical protein QXH42_08125 [Thermoplasmata archaeon]
MPLFRKPAAAHADALLEKLAPLQKNILDAGLRASFVEDFRRSMEALCAELEKRPESDPHRRLASMLRVASLGLQEDEFTTPKLEALRHCFMVLGASAMAEDELRRCHFLLLQAGLLGIGFSGGRRVTVDGKY